MIKHHVVKLNKPDVMLANDCLLQLESLGVLDKKSKKRIIKKIKNGYATHTGHNALNHVYSFIDEIFNKK